MKKAKDLAALVDRMYTLRTQRLAKQKEVDSMAEEERAMKAQLIDYLKENETSAIGGALATVTIKRKARAQVGNWDDIHRFIIDNDAWDLMYRRLNESAVKERLEQGVEVPGVVQMWFDDLSVTKVK